MTPAIMGLSLAGVSEVSTLFRPSVAHYIARFVGAAAIAAYFAALALWSASVG